jgi:hypothetical protein
MPHATKGKELLVTTPNAIGALGTVTGAVSKAGVNFITMSAWGEKDKGFFRLITSDNDKAAAALKNLGYKIEETDVLLVNLGNKPGTFAPLARKIGDAGIEINYCYATAWSDTAVLVLSTKDNDNALNIIAES